MAWSESRTDHSWQELAHSLRTEWEGGPVDRQRMLELANELMPQYPDMRHTLTHLARRMTEPRHEAFSRGTARRSVRA